MTVLHLLALLLGIWLGRRITLAGLRIDLRVAEGERDKARYLLDLSRQQQAEHLAVCPLHRADHGDAA